MILPIPPYPAKVLRERSREVRDDEFGPELEKLVADMIETMYHAEGVGLAAPQIGRNLRVIVYDISAERNEPHALVNPRMRACSRSWARRSSSAATSVAPRGRSRPSSRSSTTAATTRARLRWVSCWSSARGPRASPALTVSLCMAMT